MKSATPIVIHIPHASRRIPHDIRGAILLSDSELEEELAKVTDAYTDELFKIDAAGAQTFIFRAGDWGRSCFRALRGREGRTLDYNSIFIRTMDSLSPE